MDFYKPKRNNVISFIVELEKVASNMATDQTTDLGAFGTLFNKSVPHILEKIFFSLDYDSFVSCVKVCRTWNGLLSSESYQARLGEMWSEKNRNEEDLCYHVLWENIKEIRYLISRGVDPNCRGGMPLYYAMRDYYPGHKHVFDLLLDAGAQPNLEFQHGETPLNFAVRVNRSMNEESLYMVKRLLQAGALPNNASKNGDTPLYKAVDLCNIDVVELLLDFGADPNMTNHQGDTPLHMAASSHWRLNDYSEIVKLLLGARADPNKVNKYGDTPLHTAVSDSVYAVSSTGYTKVAKILLNAGADPNKTNSNGETAISPAARKKARKTLLKLLNNATKRKNSENVNNEPPAKRTRKMTKITKATNEH